MKPFLSIKQQIPLILLIGIFLIAINCTAQTNTFNGATNKDWETTTNWSLGAIPVAGEDIVIASNCQINSTPIPATGILNSITVNSGDKLEIEASTTINATTLNIAGEFENDGNTVIAVINTTTVNLSGSGYIDLADANTNNSSGTTLNIAGNLSATGTSVIHHNNGNSTAAYNVNFNGSNIIQTWNEATALPDKLIVSVDGTDNSLQLQTAMTLSGKSTFSVSSGDTIDCQTFQISGMTSSGNGSFTLNSGAAIKIGSTSGLNGNVSSSIATITLNGSSNTFIYTGTANQVSGSLLPATVLNLTMRNTGSTENNGVTLSQAVTVTGQLTLADGIIVSTSANILNLTGLAATVSPPIGNSDSYVSGPMTETGATTSFIFPTGSFSSTTASANRWADIGITDPGATNKVTAQYMYTEPTTPTVVNPADVPELCTASTVEFWDLTESVATAITPTLYWQSGPASGIYTYTSTPLEVADFTAGEWNNLGGTDITGTYPGAGTITATSSISSTTALPVTFASTDCSAVPLPITLTSFTATYIEETNSVLLDWIVASQINSKDFIIEKTLDGINYTEVDTTPGAGTTPFSITYSTADNDPTPGVSYYRLKQIDMDGNPTDFPPAVITIEKNQSSSVNIYPNPVAENANVTYISQDNQPITANIVDLMGRIVSSRIYSQIQEGENNFSLNTSNLSQGVYLLNISNGQKTYRLKFIKQ